MPVQVGQTLTFGLTVRDAAGALADLGGGDPTATLTKPDGTTTAATVTRSSVGTYDATYTSDQVGRWSCTWDGSGDNSGGLPYTDVADVWPANPRQIISLADARAALNVAASKTTHDHELRGYLVAAGVVIDHLCGTVLAETIVETVSGRGRAGISLAQYPTTVTSVTEDGTTLTEGVGWCWDECGNVWRGTQPRAATWSDRTPRNVVITYTAGSSVLPENVRLAAAHLVRHWWQQSQQTAGTRVTSLDVDPGERMVAGYAIPNFVADLLSPSDNSTPGFA